MHTLCDLTIKRLAIDGAGRRVAVAHWRFHGMALHGSGFSMRCRRQGFRRGVVPRIMQLCSARARQLELQVAACIHRMDAAGSSGGGGARGPSAAGPPSHACHTSRSPHHRRQPRQTIAARPAQRARAPHAAVERHTAAAKTSAPCSYALLRSMNQLRSGGGRGVPPSLGGAPQVRPALQRPACRFLPA